MLKVILFCAILAYLSGVEAQQQPQTWISTNPATTFFRRLNDRTWQEFSTSTGRFASNFTVLDSILNNGVLSVLFLKKDDGNFVVLTRNAAFFSTTGIIGTFFRFANGLWGDANRNPINRMSKSSEQRTPRTILVKEKNGRLTFEEVSYGGKNIDRPSSDHHVSVPVGPEIAVATNDTTQQQPQTWISTNPGTTFFKRLNNCTWEEFSNSTGQLASSFTVLDSIFNNGILSAVFLKKDDGNFVTLTSDGAFFSTTGIIGSFFRFANGFWGDANRNPINRMSKSSEQRTPRTILVKEKNGRLTFEIRSYGGKNIDRPSSDHHDSDRLEVWTNSENKSNFFVKFRPFLWVEFVDGVPVNTFTLVKHGVTVKMVTLKNNNPDAGDHSFVTLDSNNAYRGMTQMEVKQYATGSFSFLAIPN